MSRSFVVRIWHHKCAQARPKSEVDSELAEIGTIVIIRHSGQTCFAILDMAISLSVMFAASWPDAIA